MLACSSSLVPIAHVVHRVLPECFDLFSFLPTYPKQSSIKPHLCCFNLLFLCFFSVHPSALQVMTVHMSAFKSFTFRFVLMPLSVHILVNSSIFCLATPIRALTSFEQSQLFVLYESRYLKFSTFSTSSLSITNLVA